MPTIDAIGNYIVITQSGQNDIICSKKKAEYNENSVSFSVYNSETKESLVNIPFSESADWDNDSAVAYSTTTLRTFLRANTAS